MPEEPAPPSSANGRPRTVTVAFWCWVIGAVLTAALGMLVATQPDPRVPLVIRGAGGFLVVVGLAQAYLAGQARKGRSRFAYAAMGLAMITVVFVALLLLFGASMIGILFVAVIMALLIGGSVMSQRPTSQQWFDSQAAA
jgi:hypothetical protein